EELSRIHPFLVIDHHQGNKGFGDLHWVEPHRSSTGEMIYDLAEELGVATSCPKKRRNVSTPRLLRIPDHFVTIQPQDIPLP
ncbi:MAG: hypothetical protein D3914_10880, partial [Candidatus Electrothrix sp. LOE2]|nr:hypothetical protein [Candidatus Electrothrix sp. LOE2]